MRRPPSLSKTGPAAACLSLRIILWGIDERGVWPGEERGGGGGGEGGGGGGGVCRGGGEERGTEAVAAFFASSPSSSSPSSPSSSSSSSSLSCLALSGSASAIVCLPPHATLTTRHLSGPPGSDTATGA